MTKSYGRFKGFGPDPGGAQALIRAAQQARWRDCGGALENLGKAKILLGAQARKSARAAKLIDDIEHMCPKTRVVAVRADVAKMVKGDTSTDWNKVVARIMEKPLKPLKNKRRWIKGKGWKKVPPSPAAIEIHNALLERQAIARGLTKKGRKSNVPDVRPYRRRGGELKRVGASRATLFRRRKARK